MTQSASDLIDRILRADWGRLLSVLIADLRDFQMAEDCLSDAAESALRHWDRSGPPANPQGWLVKVARRRAIDRLRRAQNFARKEADLAHLMALDQDPEETHDIPDERLRLIFTACHPALDQKTRVALTLRSLCGLTTEEIARAFLDKPPAMAQRLVRARKKIQAANIPFVVPGPDAWGDRLHAVLTVIYLIYNEGYAAPTGRMQLRRDLCEEAIYLGRLMLRLAPREPEAEGLVALMLLSHARRAARTDAAGNYVALSEQDRTLWDRGDMTEGRALIDRAEARNRPGLFQLQARVAACHAEAPDHAGTDWQVITSAYDGMLALSPSPVIALNRAVALSFMAAPQGGPGAALRALVDLAEPLARYQPFHAARADLLARSGDPAAATAAYDAALSLTTNEGEWRFLSQKRDQTKKEAEQSSAQVQQGG